MPALERTYEAVVLDWAAVAPGGRATARAVGRRIAALLARYVDVAVLTDDDVAAFDRRMGLRPPAGGRLFLATEGGAAVHVVDARGPRPCWRHRPTDEEAGALDRTAALVVERLGGCGLVTAPVPAGASRRRIDLVPDGDGLGPRAPSRARIAAVTARLHAAGIPALASVAAVAQVASKDAGVAAPRIATDVGHLDVALADRSDAIQVLLEQFARVGVGPGLVLVLGHAFGPHGGAAGPDAALLVDEAARATVVSVGDEPEGPPPGVRHLAGGPRTVLALLDEQLRRRARRRVPSIDDDPEWVVAFDDTDALRARSQESLFALADGVVGVRGSHEEPDPHEAPLVLANGIYADDGPAQHLLAGPSPLALELHTARSHARRLLDLRTGVLLREQCAPAEAVRTMRFVAAGQRGVVAMRAEGGRRQIGPGPPVRQLTERPMASGRRDGDTWARTTGEYGGIAVVVRQRAATDGDRRTIERLAGYATEPRRPPTASRAAGLLDRVDRMGFEGVLAEHRATWAQRWVDAGVAIPDDPAMQLAVRFALFQLWNSVGRQGETAVGARGLTGPGYAGHVFWDADVFVLPAIVSMSPPAARAMLEYRLRRLPQARTIARMRGLDGARFPWESAADGYDVTPTSGRAAGEWVPILTGQLEEHVAADVAWAASHYADWTGDAAFLTGVGRPLVTDAARYWASRAWTGTDGRAHIRHVIGPDEYHEDVDDNVFTNVMARWNLRRAAALERPSAETAAWLRLADALVDGYDERTHRHEQFVGYDRLEPLLAADVGTPPLAADLLLGAARTSAAQIIKQPDVLMAHHLLPDEMPAGSLATDLDFYLPRTAHGSSLSPAVSASVLARAGRPDEALPLLDIAARLDLDDVTGMTGSGLHLATLAGVWQALLFGFAGVRVKAGSVLIDPHLPTRWRTLELRFRCLGRHLRLQMGHDETVVTVSRPVPVGTPAGPPVRVAHQLRFVNTGTGWVVHR